MIALTSAVTATVLTFGFNLMLNLRLKRRDERRERRVRMYEKSLPELNNKLLHYLKTNYENGWSSAHDTEILEQHLLALYRDAVIAGAEEAALCNIFRELAQELQQHRLQHRTFDDPPRFMREGGPAKRNYDYAIQAAEQIGTFRHWLDLKIMRSTRRTVTSHLKPIEIDREKTGEDLSRYNKPTMIDGDALRQLLGEGLLDCRVLDGFPLAGTTFDIKVSQDACQEILTSSWAYDITPLNVSPLPEVDGIYVIRCITNTPTTLHDEFTRVDFNEVTSADSNAKILGWQ
ncbi:hypothetical protein XU06_28305 [Rhodococcus erythropolis]|uniref:hypothetical protein n=1 Tax=Rhodococcus erythropolis TaxID=1833 RepID=UPI00061B7786|nr:hypothetical protein [Rhodococcus erythropolis]AKE00129.1 hypothetical protein XU06_28305 [Rhodococcus erythropolis]